MDRMLLPLAGLVFVLMLGAGGAIWWYTHPPMSVRLWPLPAWTAPESLKAHDARMTQRAATYEQALKILAASSEKTKRQLERDLTTAREQAKPYRRAAEKLRPYVPKGATEADRWADADRAVVAAFK